MPDETQRGETMSQRDHDLLIELKTLMNGLVEDVREIKNQSMKEIGELSGKKADNADLTLALNQFASLSARVMDLEQFRWKAVGALMAAQPFIAMLTVWVSKHLL